MPIPFILAGFAAIASAATATAAAVTTVAGLSLVTIGGLSITVGGVLAAATTLGVAGKIFNDVNEYSSACISESEKEKEKKRLQEEYLSEIAYFSKLFNQEISSDLKRDISNTLNEAQKLEQQNEFFNAINLLNNFKLLYAEKKADEIIAKEAERVAKKLLSVREETLKLRS